MTGAELLRRARCFFEGPIVVLSAEDRETENVRLLDLGADDYVAKPFRKGELLARLRVAARNRPNRVAIAPVVRAGECEIDLLNTVVKRAGVVVKLTPREYELLARLVEGRGRVLTHQQLLTMIWGPSHASDVQYLRVFVAGLRRKLEVDPASPRYVVTEAGVGYRLVTD
jgi:two-component system KDP operon response regulator KdpE